MKFSGQRRIAAKLTKGTQKRIRFKIDKLADIKEAITRADIRSLINQGSIILLPKQGVSRGRARVIAKQKAKGRKRGAGSRKGKQNARLPRKTVWISKVRLQRKVLRELKVKGEISNTTYVNLYRKAKGGFFRSRRHLELYIQEGKK